MDPVIKKLRVLRARGMKKTPERGIAPPVVLTNDPTPQWVGMGLFIVTGLVVFVAVAVTLIWLNPNRVDNPFYPAGKDALVAGAAVAAFYYLLPFVFVILFLLRHQRRPPRDSLSRFSRGQKFVCLALMAFGLVLGFNHVYPALEFTWFHHRWPHDFWRMRPYVVLAWHEGIIVGLVTLVLAVCLPWAFPRALTPRKKRLKGILSRFQGATGRMEFGLWLGRSTGRLSDLFHRAGVAASCDIVLTTEEAAQNLLILGGIGAGKTTRLMQPLLAQLLDQGCGGLLFDVKGDVKVAAFKLAEMTGRQIVTIGPNHTPMNLLEGLTPEVAASFLKSAFLLSGGARLDGFWVDTASELCRNTLGLLSFLPAHYTLQGLYNYLFDDEERKALQAEINPLLVTLEPTEQRLLKTYLRYHDTLFAAFDEKVKSGVNATVAQALAPFNHPELIDAFCQQTADSLNMEAVLDGTVYLVDMPLSRWGLGGKVAYTFIKLRFFNVMQSRNQHPDWNQDLPIFFMCDEYQELVSASKDGLSDLNFWDKARSSKTIGIISAQSISSFYAALGDRDLSHALLQNFRQKICFRTEDEATLTMMDRLAGRAKVQRKTHSQTTGDSSRALTEPTSTHHSTTQSITEVRESVLDATLFRNLSPDQAVALLSIQGHSMDDVLELLPVFV